MDVNGLMIKNITQSDNGMYTCRAEVKSEGRYDERRLNVMVHSGSIVLKSIVLCLTACFLPSSSYR